ncbi:MAG TPA: hypothetical protein DC042_07885 [Bacteroidales bacterium]|nr:hypothetical protein [Bacteroidales bacterium]
MKKMFFPVLLFLTGVVYSQNSPDAGLFPDLKFRNVGPARGGRVTTVTGVTSRPNEFYMGATGGGVWKTTDYGESWRNVSDGFFATGSIGAIRVSESNPDVVWVGTGSDGIRSNVIIGKGIYQSKDAGKTWKFLGLENSGQIGAVEIHPENPDICWVAAIGNPFKANPERGVYKTTNGGKSWVKVLYISDSTGACDLEICPSDPNIVYASVWTGRRTPWTIISGSSEGGVYKSSDGGESWKKLTDGLPGGIVGKSDLAVCKTEPGLLYVLMEAADGKGGLYLSENYGGNFTLISDRTSLLDRPFYYTNVDVDPTNPDIIHVNSTTYYKSADRGKTWERRSTPHGDNHDIWINPANTDIMIQSNDGGANVTRDGGKTWSTQMNQPTAELYQVDLDDQFIYWLYAGQQDNSTVAISSASSVMGRRGGVSYLSVGGCETGPAVPKPGNHNIVYANCKGKFGVYNKITGAEKQYNVGAENMYGFNPKDLKYRFQRVAPIYVSPHNPNVVYHCSQYVHKTTDDGVTWETISPDLTAFEPDKQVVSGGPITRDVTGEEFYSTIYAITESKLKEGVIWVGANDGPVHVTQDGGKTWKNVTPPDMPKGGRIQTVEASPHDPAKAYFAAYRYLLGDFEPYIYRTRDYGKTWVRLTNGTNGIPADWPTRVVREDPDRAGLLYAGTEFGLFISSDDGQTWQPFQLNLPVVPVTDIKVYRQDLVLSTMGRSFWILDNISFLHQPIAVGMYGITLLKPRKAFRSPDISGTQIDYYLVEDAKELKLEVLSSSGEVITTLRADKEAGSHRSLWSLRAEGSGGGSIRRGSFGLKVPPGIYTIRLSAAGQTITQPIEIGLDPRLEADGLTQQHLEEQYDLCRKVMTLQTEARELSARIDTLSAPLKKKVDAKGRLTRKKTQQYESLKILHNEMVTAFGTYMQPMLLDQINYLFSMISRTDQRPGRDAWMRYEELKTLTEGIRNNVTLIR